MNEALWTGIAVVEATGGRPTQADPSAWQASGVSIDSRTVAPGDLFVAIRGDRHDGHRFTAEAFAAGAAAAIVDSPVEGLAPDAPLVWVEDTTEALRALARAARTRSNARICGITGSVGKTGTKDALTRALSAQGKTHASAGNLNNHWGLPLSLARLPADARFAVFEMGMNHAGEIAALTRLARPHVSIITAIAPVHLEFFESIEGIADAKAEIFEGMDSSGVAVLNADDDFFERLRTAAAVRGIATILSFGAGPGCDARLVSLDAGAMGSTLRAEVAGKTVDYRLDMPGEHWARNSLAVLAAAHALGADTAAAAAALAGLEPAEGRGQRFSAPVDGGTVTVIDESYNASPPAMRAALRVLAGTPADGGRRIAVLGDMLELGEAGGVLHAALAEEINSLDIDLVFTAGPLMARLDRALPEARRGGHAGTAEKLVPMLLYGLRPGDVLSVKGSLGSRMGRVIDALRDLSKTPRRAANGE